MKKYLFLVLSILLLFAFNANAATTMYGRTILIGGTTSVDNIPSAGLLDGDLCITITSGKILYYHRYESTSSTAESSPDVIDPDDNGAADGRWELVTALDMGVAIDSSGNVSGVGTLASGDITITDITPGCIPHFILLMVRNADLRCTFLKLYSIHAGFNSSLNQVFG